MRKTARALLPIPFGRSAFKHEISQPRHPCSSAGRREHQWLAGDGRVNLIGRCRKTRRAGMEADAPPRRHAVAHWHRAKPSNGAAEHSPRAHVATTNDGGSADAPTTLVRVETRVHPSPSTAVHCCPVLSGAGVRHDDPIALLQSTNGGSSVLATSSNRKQLVSRLARGSSTIPSTTDLPRHTSTATMHTRNELHRVIRVISTTTALTTQGSLMRHRHQSHDLACAGFAAAREIVRPSVRPKPTDEPRPNQKRGFLVDAASRRSITDNLLASDWLDKPQAYLATHRDKKFPFIPTSSSSPTHREISPHRSIPNKLNNPPPPRPQIYIIPHRLFTSSIGIPSAYPRYQKL
ncbi:uncharacterized protein PAN0_024d6118 [Moesziomyces antarcticus]|uniref:Uncharacterized protein n=1 Tax=Pseudozyma antarctica TaxID=84753 RepID=A0A081CMJ2_PSEA2|nr:uncharacterized protein PAN0_024d6118 [Moesziomyces antarcticus]GAK67888.1 hypothetical protein PAN0_024d6118 [Moesziomyces antarcticus]